MSVAGVLPAVACNFVGAANAASREHDCIGTKNFEATTLALVTKRAHDAIAIFQQRKNRVFHINLDALMHAVILQGTNHFEPGAITHVRETWILMPAKISLQNPAVLCPIENRAPGLKLAHAIRRFLRV